MHALNDNEVLDVIVVGGSFAGQAAALQLARARKAVLLIDAQLPRNRFAAAAHGFLGQDWRAPAAIMQDASRQLLAYPTAAILHASVHSARQQDGLFVLTLTDGSTRHARRLVLATGVTDTLPPIDGMQARWGQTVLHCPYCHGYEIGGGPIGVLGVGAASLHQALLLPDWGDVTFFTQGTFEPVPMLTGLAFGHIARRVTIPFGAQGRLVSAGGEFVLTLSGYPTVRLV